jgi:hypothetical protein
VSNVGKWDKHYAGVTKSMHYGDSPSYRIGGDWLADCPVVEDWGCGLGWFRHFCKRGYRGVDGTHSRFADVVADLATYTSDVDGIFMRHVLEHNFNWQRILANACNSFRQRMALVIFTPFGEAESTQLSWEEEYDVPTLALNQDTLESHFEPFQWSSVTVESPETFYGSEYIYLLERQWQRS